MERQLGTSEENWTRCVAGGTGIGIFSIALKQHLDSQIVAIAARSICESHALLRSHIVKPAGSKSSTFQVRSDFAPVVESMPWPDEIAPTPPAMLLLKGDDESHTLSRALHQISTAELNLPFAPSPDSSPVDIFQVHVYHEPSQTYTVIVLRFHCGACDRHSTVIAAGEFVACLDAAAANNKVNPAAAAAAVVAAGTDRDRLLPSMEDLAPKAKTSKGFLKKGFDAVGYALNSSKCSLLPFQPGFGKGSSSPFRSEILNYSLGKPGTQQLQAACKRENTTIPAALSAAFLKAAADVPELKQKKLDTFGFTSVLSCRPYFDPPMEETVVGNYSAGLPQDEQVKESVGLWELARHISAATEKSLNKKHHFSELQVLNMLLSQVLKHPSITPSSSMRTALFTIFADGPARCSWDGKRTSNVELAGTLGPTASMHLIGACFTAAELLLLEEQDEQPSEQQQAELLLTFTYAVPLYSASQLHQFLSSALQLLAKHCA